MMLLENTVLVIMIILLLRVTTNDTGTIRRALHKHTVVKQFDDVDGRNHQHTSKYHIHVIYGRRILTSVGDGLDFELNRQQVSLTTRYCTPYL